MDILRENFEEQLPNICAAIADADFISYDYEFTGLFYEKDRGLVDTPSDRYQRHRKQCVKFLPVQCGICTFKYNEAMKNYSYSAYNVYLFPHSLESMSLPDKCFILQSSSIDFLVRHGFDFNKAFCHGVGFVSAIDTEERKTKYEKRCETLCEDLTVNKSPSIIPVPKNLEEFMNEKTNMVQEFIAKNPAADEDIRFFKLNSFQRKLLFVHLPKLSDSLIIESEYSLQEGPYLVIKMNPGGPRDPRKEYEEKRDKMMKQAENQSGFSKIIDAISKSKAILIGHNQGIDLLHTLHQFIAPLPETYDEFKDFVTSTFPRLIDTKFMASLDPLKEHLPVTHLSSVYAKTEIEPFKAINLETQGEEMTEEKFHDAAFDAFCTGRTCLSMMEFLSAQKKSCDSLNEMKEVLVPYFHKIPLMDNLVVSHWNLGGTDEIPGDLPIFHINFPSKWRIEDIKKAFEPVLTDANSLRIYWIDQENAWVKLFEKHSTKDVENLSNPDVPFCVKSLSSLWAVGDEGDDQPRAKKRRISDQTNDVSKNSTPQRKSFVVPDEW